MLSEYGQPTLVQLFKNEQFWRQWSCFSGKINLNLGGAGTGKNDERIFHFFHCAQQAFGSLNFQLF